jgi:lysophospholipase-3
MLWVNLKDPPCTEELELAYNADENRYTDKSGVVTTVPGFGETETVECMVNDTAVCATDTAVQYFRVFVDYFVAKGYRRGVDIKAAPYNWRLAADSLDRQGYYSRVTELVEEMYKASGERVAVVAHSMGGPVSLYFFTHKVSAEWKTKYISVYVPLSGDFAGSSWALESVVSATYPSAFFPQVARSFESLYWIMPRNSIYKGQVLIDTPSASFDSSQYEKVFDIAGYPLGWTKYKPTTNITSYDFPGVKTYCFHGSDLPTPQTYKFITENLRDKPTLITGAGDGLVNKISLETCLLWSGNPQFHHAAFSGVNHVGMVKNITVLETVASAILSSAR